MADGGGLENRYGVTPIVGSNPTPSAPAAGPARHADGARRRRGHRPPNALPGRDQGKSAGQSGRPVDSWTWQRTVTGSVRALHNDPVTQRSAALSGVRRRTRARPTFRLSAALPAATDTEESRVHQPASQRTRPTTSHGPAAPSELPALVRTGRS